MLASPFLLVILEATVMARPIGDLDKDQMHPDFQSHRGIHSRTPTGEETTSDYWFRNAQNTILNKLNTKPIENVAKNVILFLGDGMSIPTLSATRVLLGGEEVELSFEKLPFSALSKTYCVNAQTADSACTATAYLTGVKNNIGMIGVTAAVKLNDCDAMLLEENQVESIAKWSQDVGKRTGIVTTSTVTDASPAGAFAKIANRKWQTDAAVAASGADPARCHDIAFQLVKWGPGRSFNIILGGGSRKFLNSDTRDEFGYMGQRTDGLNLIEEWLNDRTAEGHQAQYVWNRSGLLNLDEDTDYVLGLFSSSYMPYNLQRDPTLTPSLVEMTEVAINIASKENGTDNGYFLFIEGGRIDHAHHNTLAKKSFDETIEFGKAIQKALDMTNEQDTLIVVTSDHSHTMSISGYPGRNNPILGRSGVDDKGGVRLTVNYANGPALVNTSHDYGADDTTDPDYKFPGLSYLNSETHGGDDVGIFARGPWAHLFTGVLEQNTIPHIMAYASCVGDGLTACSLGIRNFASLGLLILIELFFLYILK